MSDDFTSITSHLKKSRPLLPWPEALQKYQALEEDEKEDWGDMQIFYPYPLGDFAILAPIEAQKEFQLRAYEASTKWQTKFAPIARIYPTPDEWKEEIITLSFDNKDLNDSTIETHIANRVTGKLLNGQTETQYFLLPHKLKKFQKELEELCTKVNDVPFFPLPIFGISTRLEKMGLSKLELKQASALFRTEMEAYLLELWSHICPTMSTLIFRRDWDNIWRMCMDLWKEDHSNEPTSYNTFSNVSFDRDTPPHVTKRKPRRTTQVAPDFSTIDEENEDDGHHYNQSRSDTQNLYINIASRHVGTQADKRSEPDIQLGRGRLRESIQGPQYFHGYSKPLSDSTADF